MIKKYTTRLAKENKTPLQIYKFAAAFNKSISNGLSEWMAAFNGFKAIHSQTTQKAAVKVCKIDQDKRMIFGFFSIIEKWDEPVVDLQGDVILSDDLEEAVYNYVLESRAGDERHDGIPKAELIESMFFSKEKQDAMGIWLGLVGWWGGFKVHDDSLWESIKAGDYTSFSIGGTGLYESIT